MAKVSAADFQKHFGAFSDAAQREPVTITKHGRDNLVLMSAEAFERFKAAYYAPKAFYAWEAPDELVYALETAKAPESAKVHDHEMEEE